jgi:hypothetical protein
MVDAPERGAPTNLRGWLSEVYIPALLAAQAEQLVRRLGERATVDDPIFGRASGRAGLTTQLERASAWFGKRLGTFEPLAFTTGSDRDVTEGTLRLVLDGRPASVPVAVVAERRPEREVEVRVYYSTHSIQGTPTARSPLVPRDDGLGVPPPVAAHLAALSRGDVDALVATFENGATLRDPSGVLYMKDAQGGALRAFYEKMFASSSAGQPGIEVIKGGRADDGSTCALEYTVARLRGRDIAPQPGLAVYERGESGLLRAARLYHDY